MKTIKHTTRANCLRRTSIAALLLSTLVTHLSTPSAHAQSTISAANPHAWSANTGFITFRHSSPAADSGVVIGDAALSGKAWSANCGWINLASNGLRAASIKYMDTDNDDIADAWEIESFGNLSPPPPRRATRTVMARQTKRSSSP